MSGNQEFSAISLSTNEYALYGNGTLYGGLNAGIVAKEVYVGAGPKLAGRKTLLMQADPSNTGIIYLGFTNAVSGGNYFYVLAAGAAVVLKLHVADAISVWCLGSAANQFMGVAEGKSS